MPRPKRHFPVVRREIILPENIAAILETLFYDPILNRAKYSAIPEYILGLIREDLKRRGLL